ncbi:MAG: LPS biosynthesis protein [Lysobacteraceae bacterium]|nr:MAG: LPS biosynthesis protein [Xanthomonadaceae bacterium]
MILVFSTEFVCMSKLSVAITTFNNQATIASCLQSAEQVADEIVVLDSGSTDRTLQIIADFDTRVISQPFAGYSAQKQAVIDQCSHDWILLLDSDEVISPALIQSILQWKQSDPQAQGYRIVRVEQMFWQMQHPRSRHNAFLRLFDRRVTAMSDDLVHESPRTDGAVTELDGGLLHYSETSIELKVDKLNRYSTLWAKQAYAAGKRSAWWRLSLYPAWYFVRLFFLKRQFFNGWAGFVAAKCGAQYTFWKYAKLMEHEKKARANDSDLKV